MRVVIYMKLEFRHLKNCVHFHLFAATFSSTEIKLIGITPWSKWHLTFTCCLEVEIKGVQELVLRESCYFLQIIESLGAAVSFAALFVLFPIHSLQTLQTLVLNLLYARHSAGC